MHVILLQDTYASVYDAYLSIDHDRLIDFMLRQEIRRSISLDFYHPAFHPHKGCRPASSSAFLHQLFDIISIEYLLHHQLAGNLFD